MRKCAGLLSALVLCSVGSTHAGQPVVSVLLPDGTITWTNISTDCVAVVEEFSPSTSGHWVTVYAEVPTALVSSTRLTTTNSDARFRIVNADNSDAPTNMVLIPGGVLLMGDNLGDGDDDLEQPVHSVYVSPFYMDRFEVTKALWDQVHTWWTNGGGILPEFGGFGKSDDHPIHTVTWQNAATWCNARSLMEGLTPCYDLSEFRSNWTATCNWEADGYRLPTDAEWEKAARGGLTGRRFHWGDTVDHSHANYSAYGSLFDYDPTPYTSPTPHPDYDDGVTPFTSPAGSFAPNAYGLFDMSGNVWEWCWDAFEEYLSGHVVDPRGPGSGAVRVIRGGGWSTYGETMRSAFRFDDLAVGGYYSEYGFRCVRGL